MGLLGKLASGGMFGIVGLSMSKKDKKGSGSSGKQVNGGPRIDPAVTVGAPTVENIGGDFSGGFRSKARALDAERKNRRGF